MVADRNHYLNSLAELINLQKEMCAVSPIFNKRYPVTIVIENTFEIYDLSSQSDEYIYVKSAPCPFPIPQGVKAAFPLECYDDKISAIVSPDAFGTQEGYIFILHEFVHCAQYMWCEDTLKNQLSITHEYKAKNDYMWEITHPFPYESPSFISLYKQYLDVLTTLEYSQIESIRRKLKCILNQHDYEYLLWQEWKEGFARFIENKVRKQQGIQENHYGSDQPYGRASFYESGCRFISAIEYTNPNGINDMREVFAEMEKCGA